MIQCCRPLRVEVFALADAEFLAGRGWRAPEPAPYRGLHGMAVPRGEHEAKDKQ